MIDVVVRATKVVLLFTLLAGATALVTDGLARVILESYLLGVGAVLLLALVRTIRVRVLTASSSPFDSVLLAMRRRPIDSTETPLAAELRLSRLSAFHAHVRLRPLISEVAAHRLWSHYGVDLQSEPGRAAELLGPATWELVRPERPPPSDRLARGSSLAELGTIVTELERL
jgi:hypothetical protein